MTSSCIRSDSPGNSLSSSCLSFSISSSRSPQLSPILSLLGPWPCPCSSRKSLLQGKAEYRYERLIATTSSLVNQGHLPPQPRSLEKCPLGGDRTMTSATPSVTLADVWRSEARYKVGKDQQTEQRGPCSQGACVVVGEANWRETQKEKESR